MYGLGILRGLGVVFKHFVETYADDLRWLGRRYYNPEALAVRQGSKGSGIFTVQYPEERLVIPEEFRYIPFLLYEEKPDGTQEDRCTSCGICAKVCPPQCIWIERTNDPKTGRPIPAPREFYIDIDICMNCGFCAEYCPFDAIKMDHDFELSSYDRTSAHIWNKEKLSKPVSYYASIRPTNYAREEAARAEEAAKKAARKTAAPAERPAGAAAKSAAAAKTATAERPAAAAAKSPAERPAAAKTATAQPAAQPRPSAEEPPVAPTAQPEAPADQPASPPARPAAQPQPSVAEEPPAAPATPPEAPADRPAASPETEEKK